MEAYNEDKCREQKRKNRTMLEEEILDGSIKQRWGQRLKTGQRTKVVE